MNDKSFTVYLIHHSHTDIGYTESQEEITLLHSEYIRRVVENYITNSKSSAKWVCEGLWSVEQFVNSAPEKLIKAFTEMVGKGLIGLSGSYLNMTESVSSQVMSDVLKSAHESIHSLGLSANCAMTADIDGYSAGYPSLMNDVGVKYLLSLVHQHHGDVPFAKPQTPFIWKSRDNSELLAWVGEHYNLGNWVGLEVERGKTPEEALVQTEKLLPEYINKLKSSGYKYDFCPITVSGVLTDNAPPCFAIEKLVSLWNKKHADKIEIRFSTLEEFFERCEDIRDTLPAYYGDWTDWWADGIGSTPDALSLNRKADRTYRLAKLLDSSVQHYKKSDAESAACNTVMFAEHTWGYCTSVTNPWRPEVSELELKKLAYAADAGRFANLMLNSVLTEKHGKRLKSYNGYNKIKIVNPFNEDLQSVCKFHVPFDRDNIQSGYLYNDNCRFPFQRSSNDLFAGVKLKAGETLELNIKVDDTEKKPPVHNCKEIVTPYYSLSLGEGGVESIKDNSNGKELIQDNKTAFLPIYQVTEFNGKSANDIRWDMGKARCSKDSLIYDGKLISSTLTRDSDAYDKLELQYELKGFSMIKIIYTVYREIKQINVEAIMHKQSVWEPENVYLSLPFGGESRTLWAEKSGCIIRPGCDGLPHCCNDFFSLMSGISYNEKDYGIVIATENAPLIRLGEPSDCTPHYCENNIEDNHKPLFSWLMNNFWETNFKATLGGFHSFRFCLTSGENFANEKVSLRQADKMLLSAPCFACEE